MTRQNACVGTGQQHGQAAIEAMIVILVLAVMWAGTGWLGRIQDLALHASHASRYVAFMASRDLSASAAADIRRGVFDGPGNQWSSLRGDPLSVAVYRSIQSRLFRSDGSGEQVKLGGSDHNVVSMRHAWLGEYQGVLSAEITLIPDPTSRAESEKRSLFRLDQFHQAYPQIRRHTSIFSGAGHSASDDATAQRIADSAEAWSGAVRASIRSGHRVASAASRADAAWGRDQPVFDWLKPWADRLPSHHLRSRP